MRITVKDFIGKFRAIAGDSGKNMPDAMLIEAINLAFNELASVPGLSRAFSKHYKITLNAKNGVKWKLEGDFRRLADIPMLNFYTVAEGGDPCQLKLCPIPVTEFYNKNGLVALKRPGVPCEYTLEQEDDDTYLVLDRPSDVPLLLDYIAYGYPAPIEDLEEPVYDEDGVMQFDDTGYPILQPVVIEVSAVIENCILNSMREAAYNEAEDLAFSGAVLDIMTNKYIPEAIQMLNKRLGVMRPTILGEA